MTNLSEVTNYIVNRFQQDEMVNTIELSIDGIIDTKKENIYPLVSIHYLGFDLPEDEVIANDDDSFTITVLQQRDAVRRPTPSKLKTDINYIDNMNECKDICKKFVNYVRRLELDNVNITITQAEPLNNYGGANLDGFRFDITLSIPNIGYCG